MKKIFFRLLAIPLLLHGGGGEALLPLLPGATLRPALVLEGLAVWAAQAEAGDAE